MFINHTVHLSTMLCVYWPYCVFIINTVFLSIILFLSTIMCIYQPGCMFITRTVCLSTILCIYQPYCMFINHITKQITSRTGTFPLLLLCIKLSNIQHSLFSNKMQVSFSCMEALCCGHLIPIQSSLNFASKYLYCKVGNWHDIIKSA